MKFGMFYDFDLTLTEEYQQFPIFRHFLTNLKKAYPHIKKPQDYWELAEKCDLGVGYMAQMVTDANNGVFPGLTNRLMVETFAPQIQLAPGIPEWFPSINSFGLNIAGEDPEHYIISVGIEPLIRGTSVAQHATSITSGEFIDDGNNITKIQSIVNPFEKVEFIKRIAKGGDLYSDLGMNQYHINYRNCIVFGDGETDKYMFRYIRGRGGIAICVFEKGNNAAFEKAKAKLGNKRSSVSFIVPRDYSLGSTLERVVQESLVLLQERDQHCDMDHTLVHDMIRKQIRNPEIEGIVKKHYEGCKWCQKLTTPNFYFN